jgi:hypothetical protein
MHHFGELEGKQQHERNPALRRRGLPVCCVLCVCCGGGHHTTSVCVRVQV